MMISSVLTIRGHRTFHWEVQQGEYCPDQESFQQRNIELLEWKGDVVARTPGTSLHHPSTPIDMLLGHIVVDTKFVIHRADMKAAIPGAAHVTLTPSVPLTSYYLMRINGNNDACAAVPCSLYSSSPNHSRVYRWCNS